MASQEDQDFRAPHQAQINLIYQEKKQKGRNNLRPFCMSNIHNCNILYWACLRTFSSHSISSITLRQYHFS